MLRAGPIHTTVNGRAPRRTFAERGHPADCRHASWTSVYLIMRVVVLRSMSFVMTPPTVSIPVSKGMTSKNRESCACEDPSPERMTTTMTSASRNRSQEPRWHSCKRRPSFSTKRMDSRRYEDWTCIRSHNQFSKLNHVVVHPTISNLAHVPPVRRGSSISLK